MEERNNYSDPWDNGVYGTGPTEPPKNRGGLIALLLILVIFLCGIVTVLGILNVRLFTQLKLEEPKEEDVSVAVVNQETEPSDVAAFTMPPSSPDSTYPTGSVSIAIADSPVSVDNVPDAGGIPLQEIYKKNIPSVVSISCHMRSGSSTGTGVIITQDGHIVTNSHVVENAVSITVQLTDNRIFDAALVGMDEITDLAVLKIEADDLVPAMLGDSSTLRVGDSVTAIGDPLGAEFRGTYTNGIISAINRDVTVEGRTMTLIQTNAALNSGNSGGPLINCYGQVIGINTMKIGAFTDKAGVEGIGFAIPSATVKEIADQILRQGYVSGRPTLCIKGEPVSSFYQYYYRMPAGLYITYVEDGSYADYSGIEAGDILLAIDKTRVTTMEEMNQVLYEHEVGDVVTVTIFRAGQQGTADLTLTEDRG